MKADIPQSTASHNKIHAAPKASPKSRRRTSSSLQPDTKKPVSMYQPISVHLRILSRMDCRGGLSSNIQYFLGRGGISDTSTGSNSNFGSSASGAK
jgi:hypothetical protein